MSTNTQFQSTPFTAEQAARITDATTIARNAFEAAIAAASSQSGQTPSVETVNALVALTRLLGRWDNGLHSMQAAIRVAARALMPNDVVINHNGVRYLVHYSAEPSIREFPPVHYRASVYYCDPLSVNGPARRWIGFARVEGTKRDLSGNVDIDYSNSALPYVGNPSVPDPRAETALTIDAVPDDTSRFLLETHEARLIRTREVVQAQKPQTEAEARELFRRFVQLPAQLQSQTVQAMQPAAQPDPMWLQLREKADGTREAFGVFSPKLFTPEGGKQRLYGPIDLNGFTGEDGDLLPDAEARALDAIAEAHGIDLDAPKTWELT